MKLISNGFFNVLSKNLYKSIEKNMAFISNSYSTSDTFTKELITVNHQTINYLKTGNGDKQILCFSGALGSIWSDFKPQIEGLDKSKFTVIAWDPPGYGLSRPPNRKFSKKFYEDDADMAYQLLKTLGVHKFSLLGWSDGGISSMILSAKYQAAVECLVIWGSNSYILPEEILFNEKIRDIKNWSERAKAPLIKLYTKEGLQKMWNDYCDTLKAIQKENEGVICKNLLGSIRCPTLILHGSKDPMIASEHPKYLHSNIKGSKLYIFPDGKHNIHLRYAEKFNEIVSKFLLNGNL